MINSTKAQEFTVFTVKRDRESKNILEEQESDEEEELVPGGGGGLHKEEGRR